MDSPGQSGTAHADVKPSFATSDFKDTMARTRLPFGETSREKCAKY